MSALKSQSNGLVMSVLAAVTFVLRGYFSPTVDKSVCLGESAIKREKHTMFARTCLSSGVCLCVHTPHVGVRVCAPVCVCVCARVCVCVLEPARVSVCVPGIVSIPPCCRPHSPGCCLASPPLGPPPRSSCLATPQPDSLRCCRHHGDRHDVSPSP